MISAATFLSLNSLRISLRLLGLKDSRLSLQKCAKAEIIEQVTEDIDDEKIAYELGCRRMPFLARLDYPDFYRRLSSYLAYRGFGYPVIKRTAALLWQERESC